MTHKIILCGAALASLALLSACGGSDSSAATSSSQTSGGSVTGVITTSTSSSTSSTTSAAGSTASTSAQPVIAGFSPTSGPAGTTIMVTGSGFSGLASAWVGNAHDAPLSVVSDTQAKVTVPSDGTTGIIKVLNAANAAASSGNFIVTSAAVSSSGSTSSGSTTNGGSTSSGSKSSSSSSGSTSTGSTSSGSGSSSGSGTSTSSGTLKVSISGDHFVDASGKTLQLRGVNVSGLEFVAVQGWDPSNPWGGQAGPTTPVWTAMQSWNINVVRLPLNEASWLGYTCVDAAGESHDPDPGHNYQATVKQSVSDATAAGLYVILDLHWTAPKNFCPLAQNPMADADNSLNFWKSVATQFKGNPNVMFELFNEPYLYWLAAPNTEWQTEMQGGTITQYVTGGTPYQAAYTWQVASMQAMLNTVRATGATNPVLIAGVNWAGDLSQWLANKPSDPLKQIAAVWHAYPAYGTTFGTTAYTLPGGGQASYTNAQSIISAGVPVIITESGDQDKAGTVGAPFESQLLPWADTAGASYLGWAWDVWQDSSDVLIKDSTGTPTDGYGVYFKQHLNCMATSSSCK